jgi:hypothetical protein
MVETVQEPLRDRVGRALYEEPGKNLNWYLLSEEKREPWRKDADRVIPIITADYAAVKAEKNRAHRACEQLGAVIDSMESVLREFVAAFDGRRAPTLETYDRARRLAGEPDTENKNA